ncbi:MAG: hypothetical protein M3336_01620 [Chloroflexota bacterium]|nr:hypothetical protein [Chloroflexota bacterium]
MRQALERERAYHGADRLAVLATASAGVCAAVLYLPAHGYVATPLQQAFGALLGRVAFVAPLLLLVPAVARLVGVRLPSARVAGLGLLLISVLIAQEMLRGGDGGLLGRGLVDVLVGGVGVVGAMLALMCGLIGGSLLTLRGLRGQK